MRITFALIAALIATAALPALADESSGHYGMPMPKDSVPVPLAQALADAPRYASAPHAIGGEIRQVCQNKGCWVILADGDDWVRVRTGHRYFLPKDASGHAVAYGKLEKVTLNAEQAAHMAAESGDAAAPASLQEWRIDALAINISPTAQAGTP